MLVRMIRLYKRNRFVRYTVRGITATLRFFGWDILGGCSDGGLAKAQAMGWAALPAIFLLHVRCSACQYKPAPKGAWPW